MNAEKEVLLGLPLTNAERQWIVDRLEVLSVREERQLAAAMLRTGKLKQLAGKTGQELQAAVLQMKPEVAVDAVNCMLSLHDYEVCYPAGSYEQLGEYYLRYETDIPQSVIPHTKLKRIGMRYEDRHPGVFVENSFVIYPKKDAPRPYDGTNLNALEDRDWSVRLKLASPARPEGVWLRLPDYSIANGGKPDEMDMALDALRVKTVQECTLLEARCVLPEIRDLMEQYDHLEDLIYDGNNLGFILDGQGQGMPNFLEKYAAAMEYEHCHTLVAALDIAEDLRRYDFVRTSDLEEYGREKFARRYKSGGDPILTGCIDMAEYGARLLEQSGYRLNATETAYIRHDGQKLQEQTQPQDQGMTMK